MVFQAEARAELALAMRGTQKLHAPHVARAVRSGLPDRV